MIGNIRVSSPRAFSKSDVINLDQACIEIDKWCNQNVAPLLKDNEHITVSFESTEKYIDYDERTEYRLSIYNRGSWSTTTDYPYYEYYSETDQGDNQTAVSITFIGKEMPLCKMKPDSEFDLVRAWKKIKEEILRHLAAKEVEHDIIEKFRV